MEDVFDIGCGEGLFYECLQFMGIKCYVGIDLLLVLLEIVNVDLVIVFLCVSDMYVFELQDGEIFCVIVFNEVLYFVEDLVVFVICYVFFLKEDGVIVFFMYFLKWLELGVNKLIVWFWEVIDDDMKWEVFDDYCLVLDKKGVIWCMWLVKLIQCGYLGQLLLCFFLICVFCSVNQCKGGIV